METRCQRCARVRVCRALALVIKQKPNRQHAVSYEDRMSLMGSLGAALISPCRQQEECSAIPLSAKISEQESCHSKLGINSALTAARATRLQSALEARRTVWRTNLLVAKGSLA